jgi:MFS family permease
LNAPAKQVGKEAWPSSIYAWYVVGVLCLVYIHNLMDRQILSLLVKPIRQDLGATDTEISLITGFGFGLVFSLFVIPAGYLADSRSRRGVIATGAAAWSVCTTLLGLASTFSQMLLWRMGVGLSQGALSPAAYSMIADYFPPNRRATAISVYAIGNSVGSGMALLLGGAIIGLASAHPMQAVPVLGPVPTWRFIVILVGLPGVLLSLLLVSVREPLRRGHGGRVPVREVAGYMLSNKWTLLCHNLGYAVLSLLAYAAGAWNPTFFIRHYGWSAASSGIMMGTVSMIFGTLGVIAGGRFADRMADRGCRDSKMRVSLYTTLASLPFGVALYLAPTGALATAIYIPLMFFGCAWYGIGAAAIQEMMPNAMRGQASAIFLLMGTLIGPGIGPTAVALLTDYYFHNDAAIGYSLLIVRVVGTLLGAALLWLGLKQFRLSMDRMQSRGY